MRQIIILFCLIVAANVVAANEGASDGVIVSMDWPSGGTLLIPRVVIENTGPDSVFNVRFSIQDAHSERWYHGACSSTGKLQHGERATGWLVGVQITSSMPPGFHNGLVELYAAENYCSSRPLDEAKEDYFLEVK